MAARRATAAKAAKAAAKPPQPKRVLCPVEGCDKAYVSYGGLYLDKRAYHPELIGSPREKNSPGAAEAGAEAEKGARSQVPWTHEEGRKAREGKEGEEGEEDEDNEEETDSEDSFQALLSVFLPDGRAYVNDPLFAFAADQARWNPNEMQSMQRPTNTSQPVTNESLAPMAKKAKLDTSREQRPTPRATRS